MADFLHMYPAYTRASALDEYAVTFFALLNEGYRIQYAGALLAAHIGDLPHMKKENRSSFYRQLEWASKHPDDILNSGSEGSSASEIKKLLG